MSKEVKRLVERAAALFAALALGSGITILQLLAPAAVKAFPTGGQAQNRAIYMSTATPSATGQSYLVTFKPATTATYKGIILDFCSNSPIIGDSCTAPTGFDVGGATPTVSVSSVVSGTNSPINATGIGGTWTAAGLNTISGATKRTLELTSAAGSALTAGTLYNFTLTTATNPSTVGTFYARIITYESDTGDIASYTATTPGSTTSDTEDYGGFALSTATDINVTARVQESLTFCTSGGIYDTGSGNPDDQYHPPHSPLDGAHTSDTGGGTGGSTCSAAVAPNLSIGHHSSLTAPLVIDNSQVDAAYAFTQASTNATNGLAIRMHAGNTCAQAGLTVAGPTGSCTNLPGLTNGTTSTNGQTAIAMPFGTAAFGLFVSASRTTTGVATSTGTITPDANYNDGTNTTEAVVNPGVFFGMDRTANAGVTSTYGDVIASSAGPVSQVNNDLLFGATASLTTPAGIYQGAESIIATGTF